MEFWREVFRVAIGRLDEHHSMAERFIRFALPWILLAAPPWVINLMKVEVPVYLQLAPVLIYVFIWAPTKVYSEQRERIVELERKATPTLSVAADIRRGRDKLVAGVLVRNIGGDQVKACTGYVKKIEVRTVDGRRPAPQQVSSFLAWSIGDGAGKYLDFHSEAHLDVVKLFQPYGGRFKLASHADAKPMLDVWMQEDERWVFTIEIGAANSAPITKDFEFVVPEKGRFAPEDSGGGFEYAEFPDVQFRILD